MARRMKIKNLFVHILLLMGILSIWQSIAWLHIVDELFLPSPISVLHSGLDLFLNKNFSLDIGASLIRIISGFLIATIIGVPLGLLASDTRIIKTTVRPLLQFIRYVPASALLPLSIIWFGIGLTQKTFIIFLAVFPYITLYTINECLKTPKVYIETAKLLGLKRFEILRKVIFPFALPGIWLMLEVEAGAAWAIIIIAELIATSSGIGAMMIESQRFLVTSNIFFGIVILGLIGFITDYMFKTGYKHMFRWRKEI